MKIDIGMFGFGKSGSYVAQEILKDAVCDLKWVIRKSQKKEGEYASRLLGFEFDKGKIFCSDSIDRQAFFRDNRVDIIIDFSSRSGVEVYREAVRQGTKVVSAISKYDKEHLKQLKLLGEETAVLYSPNITLGINFLIEISKVLQKIVPTADVEIIEEHYRDKDEVSGTALRIAEDLGLDRHKHVNSIRVGGIIGRHEVVFGLPNQTIRIIHESQNRAAFGQGAIYAAKWLINRKKGLYTMEQAVKLSFARNLNVFDEVSEE